MTKGMIQLSDVQTAYEGSALPVIRGISCSINPGEFVIIGGPNGAGKTTLLETINGLLPIVSGRVVTGGIDVAKDGNSVRRRVGYVIQNFSFDPLAPFIVSDVVMMGRFGLLGYGRRPGEEDRRIAEEAMDLLGIRDLADRPIGKLSGGQQQKVLIAQSLAKQPDILLLDEPFSNLDLATRDFICGILADLTRRGCTIVMVSHAFDALPENGSIRVIVMNDGTITFNNTCSASEVEGRVRGLSGRSNA
ncbi:zinc/manganese transport system ATP-binding protein [Methanocalculus alkaliphilus]|uniref:metal ABC transporter ATP-binding protein n=1 Tax=Methanocalculus alkaliphilus TaxID=768730 RepID=UPI00209EFF42|nr:metal ABC transporter ATP-binding protein [Methanocalculus alkaliphilus]MCP1714354.1 zinc/manganese transport system ATP-binding protein [Methanocalculus alkaliphilus]